MEPNLPKVIEFSHLHDVKIERDDYGTRIVAIPTTKYPNKYKHSRDLPFVHVREEGQRTHVFWFYSPKADNYAEQIARGNYYWEEFVRFARGPQKRRRADALWLLERIINELGRYEACTTESSTFAKHLAEIAITHLRAGLDECKSDAQLKAEEVAA